MYPVRYNRDIHHRCSIRLRGYDYASAGAYYVTVCVKHRMPMLGDVIDGNMILNDVGFMVQKAWDELEDKYEGIETDEFIIMPNHIHGIVFIVGAGPRACPDGRQACPDDKKQYLEGHPQGGCPYIWEFSTIRP